MAFLYILAGRKYEARKHLNDLLSIDPLSQETHFYDAYIEYMSENYNASLKQLDACLEVNPMNMPVHSVKAFCLLKLERCDEAIRYFDELPAWIVVASEKHRTKALGYALNRDKVNSGKYAGLLTQEANGKDGFTASSYLFLLAGATGKNDEAFTWVQSETKSVSPILMLRYSDPLVNPIKAIRAIPSFIRNFFQRSSLL